MSTTADELRALVRLAVPIVLVQVGLMAFGVVDTMMVGRLGPEALAGVQLGHTYFFSLTVFGMGVMFAMDPLVSQAFGAGDANRIRDAVGRGLVLAAILSLPLMAAFWLGEPLLHVLTGQPTVVPLAYAYACVVAASVPAFLAFVLVRQTLQAMSIVRPVALAIVAGNLLNVALNGALIHGWFGVPPLGAIGAAWATTISRFVMLAGLLAFAWKPLAPYLPRFDRSLLSPRRYVAVVVQGGQIGAMVALEGWVFMTVSVLMLRISPLAMAGHAVALNLASLSFMVPVGIGGAASTRVGNAIGRGDSAAARRAARCALGLGASVMLVSAFAFVAFPRLLARAYGESADVIEMAALLLPVAGVFQVFDGTQAVACGVLRGAGDTRAAAWINFLGYWVIGLPAGIALAEASGPRGLWWGLTIGLAVCALLLVLRVTRRIGRAPH